MKPSILAAALAALPTLAGPALASGFVAARAGPARVGKAAKAAARIDGFKDAAPVPNGVILND